jgi:hypothetical protein
MRKKRRDMITADEFGQSLHKAWQAAATSQPFEEIPLFRALVRAIMSLSSRFRIEEYHGSQHQVMFLGVAPWCRKTPRCEISDLLIVTYRRYPSVAIRMTFLQAKRTIRLLSLCPEYPSFRSSAVFRANLEQWDLLARRPSILGVPPFDPPSNLLRDAILPSVGSFCVFHKTHSDQPSFIYASADMLKPVGQPSRKHWRVETLPDDSVRQTAGHDEAILACCPGIFGLQLYLGHIGTPLEFSNVTSFNDQKWREQARVWLAAVLATRIRQSETDAPIARELIRSLEIPVDEIPEAVGPSTIIVINNDLEHEEPREG